MVVVLLKKRSISYHFRTVHKHSYLQRHQKVKELHQLAEDLGLPLVNLALCWCLKNQNVSTLILGASKVEQLKQNLDSINHMERLDDSAMERIETILNNKP